MNKKTKRMVAYILLVVFLSCFCSACSTKTTTDETHTSQTIGGDSKVKLTQRQIEILVEVGLPTKYEDLNDSQQNDIMAIEEMLCYMEKTYNTTAIYNNFTQASPLNDESLVVVIDGKNITVSRRYENGKYVYKDNYSAVMSTEKYEDAIKSFFVDNGEKVKVFAEISKMEKGTDNILSSANASVFVFVSGEKSRTELEKLARTYAAWYTPKLNGVENVTRFYAINETDYLDIGRVNFYDSIEEVVQENRLICIISVDGEATFK